MPMVTSSKAKAQDARSDGSKRYFRSKFIAAGTVVLAGSIGEGAGQFDFNGGAPFNQPYSYVQYALSNLAATS